MRRAIQGVKDHEAHGSPARSGYHAPVPAPNETQDQSGNELGARVSAEPDVPGLLLVFAGGRPVCERIDLARGAVEIGRDLPVLAGHPDARISRRHARVALEDGHFVVTDYGSRNGTSVDGAPLAPSAPTPAGRVIRAGDSLFVPVPDLGVFARLGVRVEAGRVEGPALQVALGAAASAAKLGSTLHITGESGAGKEGIARAFHAGGGRGPFQAVNCATIPESVAERLLFGAKRGAFSGADADADGYLQSAHGGTLFLDEVAELGLPVQAKLLRALETGEVLSLGAVRARTIDLRFCSATHRDLRAQVAAGKLREDLYFRIASPRVRVPPLRDRPEEIPWLLRGEIDKIAPGLALHASLVEACLLRPWPGNVRELCAEARSAAQVALAAGAPRVEGKHLGETAGIAFPARREEAAEERAAEPGTRARGAAAVPSRAKIVGLLKRLEGNVSAAARELGVHRTQLRRWMGRHALDARAFAPRQREAGIKGE